MRGGGGGQPRGIVIAAQPEGHPTTLYEGARWPPAKDRVHDVPPGSELELLDEREEWVCVRWRPDRGPPLEGWAKTRNVALPGATPAPAPAPQPAPDAVALSWFEELFGFEERTGRGDYARTQEQFEPRGETQLRSLANGEVFTIGTFSTPTLQQLRDDAQRIPRAAGRAPTVTEVETGDVLELHALPENEGALFQAASQFNCLEMGNPAAVPEDGVSIYATDNTQGPACALACAAATVYRNYFVPMGRGSARSFGQTARSQMDNLDELSHRAQQLQGDDRGPFWTVSNGYTDEAGRGCLAAFGKLVARPENREELLRCVKIGLQTGAGVTFVSLLHHGFTLLLLRPWIRTFAHSCLTRCVAQPAGAHGRIPRRARPSLGAPPCRARSPRLAGLLLRPQHRLRARQAGPPHRRDVGCVGAAGDSGA